MKFRILLCLFCLPISLLAQYTTPNTGTVYTLDDLVAISDGVVTGSGSSYSINQDLTIAPTDSLQIVADLTVEMAPAVLVTVQGGITVFGDVMFTSQAGMGNYAGFRFESESVVFLSGATFEYGGGLKVLTPYFDMVDCMVRYQDTEGASSSAAVSFSTGVPFVLNSTFLQNESAAIGSAANSSAAVQIMDCTFTENTTGNSNRPQINLGPSGGNTIFITNCTIIGNTDYTMVGGIAISALIGGECHAHISGNEIRDNRYGIALIGNGIESGVDGNIIEDNNTQGDPLLGGSGININATDENSHTITNNQIRGNLWGITLQGNGNANLGEYADENIGAGGNVFSNNGNGGQTYALYNNTPNTISAQGNCWLEDSVATLEDVSNVIFDQADDASLGEVIYDENACNPVGVAELNFDDVAVLYPNPASGNVHIQVSIAVKTITLLDISGREIARESVGGNRETTLNLNTIAPGIYLVQLIGDGFTSTGKLVVQ